MTPHFSRTALASRWKVSVKTIDRLREFGKLPWIDIAGGRGARPIVRFTLADVEAFEQTMRQFETCEAPDVATMGDSCE